MWECCLLIPIQTWYLLRFSKQLVWYGEQKREREREDGERHVSGKLYWPFDVEKKRHPSWPSLFCWNAIRPCRAALVSLFFSFLDVPCRLGYSRHHLVLLDKPRHFAGFAGLFYSPSWTRFIRDQVHSRRLRHTQPHHFGSSRMISTLSLHFDRWTSSRRHRATGWFKIERKEPKLSVIISSFFTTDIIERLCRSIEDMILFSFFFSNASSIVECQAMAT